MTPTRYLLVISLTSVAHFSKAGDFSPDDNTYLKYIVSHVRGCIDDAETILAGRTSVFVGIAPKTATDLFKSIATVLRKGDVVHVVKIGDDIATTNAAFSAWIAKTRWLRN